MYLSIGFLVSTVVCALPPVGREKFLHHRIVVVRHRQSANIILQSATVAPGLAEFCNRIIFPDVELKLTNSGMDLRDFGNEFAGHSRNGYGRPRIVALAPQPSI